MGGEPILGVKVLRGWRRPNGQSGRANTSSLLMSQTHSDDLKSDKCFLLISFGHSGCQFLKSDYIFHFLKSWPHRGRGGGGSRSRTNQLSHKGRRTTEVWRKGSHFSANMIFM